MTGGLILPMHVSLRLRIAVLVGCLLSMVLLCLPVSAEEAVSGELTIVGAWEDEIYAQFCDAHPEVEVELKECRTDMEDADAVEKADMQAYIDMLNQYISDKEADPWLASAEEIAAYRDVAEHMHFAEHSAYLGYAQQSAYDELVGIGLQYVEGKLTQEAFIDRLNQAVYMRFTEGQ